MVCLNKILEDYPELKEASKGVQNEENFFYACKLCDGKKTDCAEYVDSQNYKSVLSVDDAPANSRPHSDFYNLTL